MACEFDNGKGLVAMKEDGSVTILSFAEGSRSIAGRIAFDADEWQQIKALRKPSQAKPPTSRSTPSRSERRATSAPADSGGGSDE